MREFTAWTFDDPMQRRVYTHMSHLLNIIYTLKANFRAEWAHLFLPFCNDFLNT